MMQPMPQGAPDQDEAQAGGGAATQLITGVQSDMKKIGALLEKSGVGSPEQMEQLSALIAQYEELMEGIVGGGDAPQKPAPGGVSSPEAGGNPNARPM